MDPHKTGLTLGYLFAGIHAVWAVLVWGGWAQDFMDFVSRLHFVTTPSRLAPFDLGTAILLVVVAGLIGYCVGAAYAVIRDKVKES